MGVIGFDSLLKSLGFTAEEMQEIRWFFENIETFLFE